MAEGFAPSTRQAVQKIPLLTVSPLSQPASSCPHESADRQLLQVRAGPRDAPELWENRLKEVGAWHTARQL